MKELFVAGFCIGISCLASAGSSDLVIAERGRPADYAIVVPAEPSPTEQYAAEELRDWTEKLTGARLSILTNATPAKAVYLNRERSDASLGVDGFRLAVQGDVLVVSGGRRGVLYGVYELLDTYGGIGWFNYDFTYIPDTGRLAVPRTLKDEQKPAFARRQHDWHNTWLFPEWESRNRLNQYARAPKFGGRYPAFDPVLGNCHTFGRLISADKYFDEHPEYFSLVNGKRKRTNTQLCMTNPNVLRLVTEQVLERVRLNLKENTGIKYYGVSQDDWNNYCECTNCAAIDAREGSHSGALLHFINQIAEEVEKVDPDAIVETLAYMYSRRPPKFLKPRHNVMPMLCSIECDFSKPMGTSRFKENVAFREDVEKWRAISKHLMIWDYTADWRGTPCPHGNFDALKGNAQYYRDCGVTELFYEGWGACTPSTEFAALKAWLSGKFLWNPDQPLQPLLERFCRGYYGKGAPYVLQYLDLLRKQPIDETKTPFTYARFIEDKPYTNNFLDESRALWKQAREAVAGSDPQIVSNVCWGSFGLDYARVAMYMHRQPVWKPIMVSRKTAGDLNRREFDAMQKLAQKVQRIIDSQAKSKNPVLLSSRLHDFRAKGFVKALATGAYPEGAATDKALVQEWSVYFPDFPPSKTTARIDDPDATDGRAIRVSKPCNGWELYCAFPKLIAIDPGVEYRLRVRVKIMPSDAIKGKDRIGGMGLYSYDTKKDIVGRKLTPADAIGKYEWIDVGTWKATNDNFVLYLTPSECPEFFFDCLEIERVK